MQVLIQSRDAKADPLRVVVERRVRFVLRRISWRVPMASVQLSDVNGPRGGLDKKCLIELRTDGAKPVVVSAVARDWRTAIDEALARAARFVRRQWERVHAERRARRRQDEQTA